MGIVVNYIAKGEKSDQEWINEGKSIRKQAEGMTRRLGEWYIDVQESRKILPAGKILSVEEICNQANYYPSSPAKAAQLVRVFPTEAHQQGFTIEDCKALLPAMTKFKKEFKEDNPDTYETLAFDKFHGRFMSDAKAGQDYYGDPDPDYKYTGPWNIDDIKRQVKLVTKGMIPAPKSQSVINSIQSIESKLDDVLGTLPKATEKKIRVAVKAVLKEESKEINKKFQDEVLKVAEEKIKPLRIEATENVKTAKEFKATAKKESEHLEARLKGVSSFMDGAEYKLILNCLHPDRAPKGSEDKFSRAFDIVKRLEAGIEK